MIRHRITKLATTFSTLNNQPFTQFLSNDTPTLQIKKTSTRSIQLPEVLVSKLAVSREEAEQFMKKKGIESKTVLINIDPSHVMGMKRMLCKTYLKEHVYKGLAQPIDLLAKQNPIKFTKVQELKFDEAIFASTDPQFIELKKRGVSDEKAMGQVSDVYDQNPNRGGQRLFKEFGVPPEYIPVVEAAHNLGNQMYFVGLNQYDVREILANYMKLGQAKVFFMQCLNYVLNEELGKQDFDIMFKHKCKEYLWFAHYNFLQPINYQQIKTFKKKLKGHYFAHPYNFLTPQNENIDFRKLKDTQPDTNKLQKQAIFSVLFGNIWNKPYTNNPFVYLTQNFHTLSQQDKETVVQIYNKHYQKYELAKSKFFQLKNQQKYNQ